MTNQEFSTMLEKRTVSFAVATLKALDKMPSGAAAKVLGTQLSRSATSVGANYREANRAESRSDFLHKLSIALKEVSESEYWLLIGMETGGGAAGEFQRLHAECRELLKLFQSIVTSVRKTTSPPRRTNTSPPRRTNTSPPRQQLSTAPLAPLPAPAPN